MRRLSNPTPAAAVRPVFNVKDTRRLSQSADSLIVPSARGDQISEWGEQNQPATLQERDRLFAVKALFVESALFHRRNSSDALTDVLAARKASGPVPCDVRSMSSSRLVRIVLDDIERIHAMHPENGPKLALAAVSALPLWTLDQEQR